jgi:hypothetical protein
MDIEEDEPFSAFHELLAELDEDPDDLEHTSVSVKHESEWCLEAFRGGHIVYQNVEDEEPRPRHMEDVPSEKIVELWRLLAAGNLAALENEPWQYE